MAQSRFVSIKSLKNQALIADKCFVAERFFDRLRGLIGRKSLESGQGMLFPRCQDIHMWFMSIPIDVVFVRRQKGEGKWMVSSTREGVRPWRLLPVHDWKATETLELPAGTVRRHAIAAGDELCIN
ncbi:MAG: DUF192 domain-containing protein [Bdellovibrionota bacterium]